MPRRKVLRQAFIAPGADAAHRMAGNVVSLPSGGQSTAELASIVERLQGIAWGMTVPAVRQPFREVRAAVPLRTASHVVSEATIRIEECRPDAHQPALTEWKRQLVRRYRIPDRRNAAQVR